MKKIYFLFFVIFILSLVSVSAEEIEEGFSSIDGLSANIIWQESLTDYEKFIINLNNIFSPQTVLGGIDYDCSLNAYRVGEALSGKTERLISTTKEVPIGAEWVRTELKDVTNNLGKGSNFNPVGTSSLFDNLNPAITYQWFQFACYPKDTTPIAPEINIIGIKSEYTLGDLVMFDITTTGELKDIIITIVPPIGDIIIDETSLTGTCLGSLCRHSTIITDEVGNWDVYIELVGTQKYDSATFTVKEEPIEEEPEPEIGCTTDEICCKVKLYDNNDRFVGTQNECVESSVECFLRGGTKTDEECKKETVIEPIKEEPEVPPEEETACVSGEVCCQVKLYDNNDRFVGTQNECVPSTLECTLRGSLTTSVENCKIKVITTPTPTTPEPAPTGTKPSLTLEEIEKETETTVKESLCVKSFECKERIGYNVRCAGDKKVVDLIEEKTGSVETFFRGIAGTSFEGICLAESKGEEKEPFDINPCVWGESIWEDNGCLAGWGIIVLILMILFFRGRR